MGSVRWAFRCGSWTPSRSEWLFAARCIQQEEKERIGQFVFAKDAKSAMVSLSPPSLRSARPHKVACCCISPRVLQAGRLLLRRFVCDRMDVPWSEIRLERSPRGKPYLAAPLKRKRVSFNVFGDSTLRWVELSHCSRASKTYYSTSNNYHSIIPLQTNSTPPQEPPK